MKAISSNKEFNEKYLELQKTLSNALQLTTQLYPYMRKRSKDAHEACFSALSEQDKDKLSDCLFEYSEYTENANILHALSESIESCCNQCHEVELIHFD